MENIRTSSSPYPGANRGAVIAVEVKTGRILASVSYPNYDPNILKYSRYPYNLKRRISGPNGHLSNSESGDLISTLIKSGLNNAMLGHLSKENNFPELAYKTVVEELIYNHYDESSISISVAKRDTPSQMINIA